MKDSIENLKKAIDAVNMQIKDKELAKITIEQTIESFLWANDIDCKVELY